MSKIKPLVEALTGIMGLLSFADCAEVGGLAGDNRTEYEEIWLPQAKAALANAGFPELDGPGREYVERFNAHIRARDARKAFPFTTRGVGKLPTIVELIRLNSFVERMLGNANEGEQIVCEYQVGYDVQEAVLLHGYHDEKNPFGRDEHYYQSWRSAVKAWQEYYAKYGALEDAEIWIYLDVFNVDAKLEFSRQIGNLCLLMLYEGEVGLYYNHMRGVVEPPQP